MSSTPSRSSPPRCYRCRNQSELLYTSPYNKNGNANRPYFKCFHCYNFLGFADERGVDPGNPRCACDAPSRLQPAAHNAADMRPFYSCSRATCDFHQRIPDDETHVRREADVFNQSPPPSPTPARRSAPPRASVSVKSEPDSVNGVEELLQQVVISDSLSARGSYGSSSTVSQSSERPTPEKRHNRATVPLQSSSQSQQQAPKAFEPFKFDLAVLPDDQVHFFSGPKQTVTTRANIHVVKANAAADFVHLKPKEGFVEANQGVTRAKPPVTQPVAELASSTQLTSQANVPRAVLKPRPRRSLPHSSGHQEILKPTPADVQSKVQQTMQQQPITRADTSHKVLAQPAGAQSPDSASIFAPETLPASSPATTLGSATTYEAVTIIAKNATVIARNSERLESKTKGNWGWLARCVPAWK